MLPARSVPSAAGFDTQLAVWEIQQFCTICAVYIKRSGPAVWVGGVKVRLEVEIHEWNRFF
jgi:hypothetical protein